MKNKRKYLILLIVGLLVSQNLFGQSTALAKFINSYAETKNFSGTILVRQNSKTIYTKSFGFANLAFKVPNKPETKYKIPSITKAFTSVLILQLFEQGKLDLNKPIKNYLPDYKGDAAEKVTVHQLLNHTSGMANIDRHLTSADAAIKNGMPHYQTPLTTDDLLNKYCSEKLVNEPGKVFDYNNADYIILGKIIERIYQKTFDDVLKTQILQPLGMKDSGMLYQYKILENLADTYFFREDLKTLANDLPVFIENWYAAGAMYSTVTDLLKFSEALFNFKIIKRETLNLMLKPGLDDYGYGVWVYDMKFNTKKLTIVKRPGRIMGAQSMLFHVLNKDTTIIIFSNTDAVGLDEFAAAISKKVVR